MPRSVDASGAPRPSASIRSAWFGRAADARVSAEEAREYQPDDWHRRSALTVADRSISVDTSVSCKDRPRSRGAYHGSCCLIRSSRNHPRGGSCRRLQTSAPSLARCHRGPGGMPRARRPTTRRRSRPEPDGTDGGGGLRRSPSSTLCREIGAPAWRTFQPDPPASPSALGISSRDGGRGRRRGQENGEWSTEP